MKLSMPCLLATTLAITIAAAASLPVTPDIPTASAGPQGDLRDANTLPEDQLGDGDDFEIVVPVARNFSSLEELFQILREDSKEPRSVSGTPPTYVKGTERNSSEYLIFLSDVGKKGTR